MLEFLYTCFLIFVSGAGLYQWGVAAGEERAEQKRKQEEDHGTFNQITNR